MDMGDLKAFPALLVGFLGEKVHVNDYITLKTIFGVDDSQIMIKVWYIVIDAPYSYNMIIWWHAFNKLGASLSTPYLCITYPLSYEWVRVIQGDQETSHYVLFE